MNNLLRDFLENDSNNDFANLIYREKLMLLQEFVSGICHEINNPLTILIGRFDMLEKNILNSSSHENLKHRSHFVKINEHLNRIKKTIETVSCFNDFNNESATNPYGLYFKNTFKSVLIILSGKLINNKITLKYIEDEIPDVKLHMNSTELCNHLFNIFLNAISALENTNCKWIRIKFEVAEGLLILHIMNSGLPIQEEQKKKLFSTIFIADKNKSKGLGIGLYNTKKSLNLNGGDIEYHHHDNNTCFKLKLKLV